MNINVEHQPNCRAVAHIRVPGEEVQKNRDEIVTYYARVAKLPGYRPGKTPKPVIAKRFSQEIAGEVEKQLINDGLRKAIQNEGLDVLNILAVKDKQHHDADQSFSFTVEMSLAPKFELPEYKGIPVKLPRIEVNDADVDHDLLHLRERYQTFEDAERAAAIGDVAVLSFTGSLDGQPLAEAMPDAPKHLGEVKEQWFLLDAEDDFLPGFYASVTGMSKGDEKQIEVKLPDDFPHEPLRGKAIVLAAQCHGVKEKKLPEIDDEFAKKIGGPDFTVETLRAEVKEAVRRRREQARDVAKSNQVLAFLHDKLEFDIPQEIINREAQKRTNDMAMRAVQNGMAQDDLMKHQEEIVGAATQQARQSVKISFILDEVAKREQLEVSNEQLSHAVANWAARSKMPVKKFISEAKKSGLIDRLQGDLLMENALSFLKDSATVEETDPEPEHCEQHGHQH